MSELQNNEQSVDELPVNEESTSENEQPMVDLPISEEAVNEPTPQKSSKPMLLIALLIVAVAIASFAAGSFYSKSKDAVVASVNGNNITKTQLYDALIKQGGPAALDSLISDKIVELEAQKQKITIPQEDIQKELDSFIKQQGGQDAYKQALVQYGYTEDQLKKQIEKNLQIKKLLEPQIKITDEEMASYFEQNKDSYGTAEKIKASHIMVDSEEKAKEVKAKLDAGGDFAALAKEYSIDTRSKDNGGELGSFGRGYMPQEFEDVAFSMEPGKISGPVKTPYGYHIIKLEEKQPAKLATLEDNKEEVKEALTQQKLQAAYPTWMQARQSEYKIVNTLNKTNTNSKQAK